MQSTWTPPYDRIVDAKTSSCASCERIFENEAFHPNEMPYTNLLEFFTLFPHLHIPLSVATLMQKHNLTLFVAKTIVDGEKNTFWTTGKVPRGDCGAMTTITAASHFRDMGFVTPILCAALATLYLQGPSSTADFAIGDAAGPNFKPFAVWCDDDGLFVQVYFWFQRQKIQLTLDEKGPRGPCLYLFDGSSLPLPRSTTSASLNARQPHFPALEGRSWFHQLRF